MGLVIRENRREVQKLELPYDIIISLLSTDPKAVKSDYQRDACPLMFLVNY